MAKTASISLRIEPAVKAQLEALYASFGISVTDAINIFLHTSLMEGGFPFQPNNLVIMQKQKLLFKKRKIY